MSEHADTPTDRTHEARIAQLLAGVWKRNQAQVSERLELIERAAAALAEGTLHPAQREQAIATAHKLSGTLGMFGFPRGTEIARSLEQEFDADAPRPELCTIEAAALRRTLFPSAV